MRVHIVTCAGAQAQFAFLLQTLKRFNFPFMLLTANSRFRLTHGFTACFFLFLLFLAAQSAGRASQVSTAPLAEDEDAVVYAHAPVTYRKVTAIDEVKAGCVYLLVTPRMNAGGVAPDAGAAAYFAMGEKNASGNNRAAVPVAQASEGEGDGEGDGEVEQAVCINALGDEITCASLNVSSAPYEVTLIDQGYSENTYRLKLSSGMYLQNSRTADKDKNFLQENASETATGTAFLFAPQADGRMKLSSKNNSITSYLQCYNNDYFSSYSGSNIDPFLFRKTGAFTTPAETGRLLTFAPDYAYVMPADATGYVVSSASPDGALTLTTAYPAGTAVPAHTALLVQTAHSGNFLPLVLGSAPVAYDGENLLECTRTTADLTLSQRAVPVRYYKFTVEGDAVGFYFGAADGAPFTMTSPTTAYLAIPTAQSAATGFRINPETVTAVTLPAAVPASAAPRAFSLDGHPVNPATLPQHSVYVQGGKVKWK